MKYYTYQSFLKFETNDNFVSMIDIMFFSVFLYLIMEKTLIVKHIFLYT